MIQTRLNKLYKKYDELQNIYGDRSLNSIYFGGDVNQPDVCFVFMNPTKRSIAAKKSWEGLRAPWIGTKNIWSLFYDLDLLDDKIYGDIRSQKGSEWTEDFANVVYNKLKSNKVFVTNLAKCTQRDARELPDSIFENYLDLFKEEMDIIKPKVIILFGNQVSSIVLNEKIAVSKCRKHKFILDEKYSCYAVYYPVGNGRINIDKSIEDLRYILNTIKEENKVLN